MAPTNVGYSLKEAISHFFRNWTTSLGAVITIFLSLFIIGLFIMGSAMLNSVIGTVEDQVVINAFISDDADQADVQAFEAELKTWSNVKSVTYKDKDDALAEYTSKMSGNADATMSALDGQNPLPASFAIEMDDPSKVESTAKKLKKNADFQKIADDGDVNASVLYGQEEVSRLFQVTNYIRIAAVVLVGLLTFIAFIFINNTIRLSITARRREIAIMRLVGASNGFIRGPFITEGVLQAILGSLLSIGVLELLRGEYRFRGYIHAKAIPGADPALVARLGLLADRISINIELPSERSLSLLAPDKSKRAILAPMKQVSQSVTQSKAELMRYRKAPQFAPAGQSTQMIIGASPETDYQILRLTEGLYQKYSLKRVFFSAYIPVAEDSLLPALDTKPPLLREHRLYQADWLLRFYQFSASEILDEQHPDFNPYLDPKCNWAVHNMHLFPVDVNRCSYEMLLRVPGIGVKSAQRIRVARRSGQLDLADLKRIGVVLKRAQYFITCKGFSRGVTAGPEATVRALLDPAAFGVGTEQLSLFAAPAVQELAAQGMRPASAAREVCEEAVSCLARQM